MGKFKIDWKKQTILVVEDDEDSYFLIKLVLKDLKANLIHARNGKEAIEICRTNANIDVVLMDINLPLLSGYEATQQIKKFRKDLPIIAQTAYAMGDEMNKCYDMGCDDYITKPIDRDKLFEMLNRCVKK